jgi:hypothetical protein
LTAAPPLPIHTKSIAAVDEDKQAPSTFPTQIKPMKKMKKQTTKVTPIIKS